MKNENMEILIENKKNKNKNVALVSFCVIIAICAAMFFSNHISKDKIKINKTNVVEGPELVWGGILVENKAKCTVDVKIKGDFYDKDNNWLGELTYSRTFAPNIKGVINPAWDLANLSWAGQIKRDEYTLLECKKSKQKMIDVGFSKNNDITVAIDEKSDKVTLTNNTNHDINIDVRLKEIWYIKNNYTAENHVIREKTLVPANKKISFHNYYNDDSEFEKRTRENSEKIETFLYGYAEED